jgi:hypothetical protein
VIYIPRLDTFRALAVIGVTVAAADLPVAI